MGPPTTEGVPTGYFLLDNKVRSPPRKWYPARRSAVQGVVVHLTAGLQSLGLGADHSAEGTARYCADTDRAVSWHAGADTDSVVNLLPPDYTAFHCQDHNSKSLGVEISKTTTRWAGMDPEWVRRTLANTAAAVRPWVAAYDIPIRKVNRTEWDRGVKGFIGHAELDPARRTDPGSDFPWGQFLLAVRPSPRQERPMYDPALHITVAAELAPPTGPGVWLLAPDGAVFAFGGARYLGGCNGREYFRGRRAARLEPTDDGRYVIVATSGERYGPDF